MRRGKCRASLTDNSLFENGSIDRAGIAINFSSSLLEQIMLAAVDVLLNDVLKALTASNESAVFPDDSSLLSRAHAFDVDVPTPATLKALLRAVKLRRIKALAVWAETARGPQAKRPRATR